jgi:hypothetical protein
MEKSSTLFVRQISSAFLGALEQVTDSSKINNLFFFGHENHSLQWAEVFRTGDDSFLHVSVFDCNDPSNTLSACDESSSSVESAMRHTHLLSAVKNDSNTVAFFVVMHYTTDVCT